MLAGRGGNIDGEICGILFCPLDVESSVAEVVASCSA